MLIFKNLFFLSLLADYRTRSAIGPWPPFYFAKHQALFSTLQMLFASCYFPFTANFLSYNLDAIRQILFVSPSNFNCYSLLVDHRMQPAIGLLVAACYFAILLHIKCLFTPFRYYFLFTDDNLSRAHCCWPFPALFPLRHTYLVTGDFTYLVHTSWYRAFIQPSCYLSITNFPHNNCPNFDWFSLHVSHY